MESDFPKSQCPLCKELGNYNSAVEIFECVNDDCNILTWNDVKSILENRKKLEELLN